MASTTIIHYQSTTSHNVLPPSPVQDTSVDFLTRFDGFFACAPPNQAHSPSRAERVANEQRRGSAGLLLPPSYESAGSAAPAYETIEQPTTLSKYLFTYGFCTYPYFTLHYPTDQLAIVFPPLWFIGMMILFMPRTLTANAESGKGSIYDNEAFAIIRRAEIQWSTRCAMAFFSLVTVIGLLILGLYLGNVGVFKR
jgi:hypothetical protein